MTPWEQRVFMAPGVDTLGGTLGSWSRMIVPLCVWYSSSSHLSSAVMITSQYHLELLPTLLARTFYIIYLIAQRPILKALFRLIKFKESYSKSLNVECWIGYPKLEVFLVFCVSISRHIWVVLRFPLTGWCWLDVGGLKLDMISFSFRLQYQLLKWVLPL